MSRPTIFNNSANFGSALILGQTNTGKSFLVKDCAKHFVDKNLFVYNDREQKFSRFIHPSKITYVSKIDELKNVPLHSVLILEDLINLQKKDLEVLRELLNYDTHHKKLYIFLIAHHIFKTKLYSLLPSFNIIVFTNNASNLIIVKHSLLQFSFENEKILRIISQFKKLCKEKKFGYFVFNTKKHNLLFFQQLNSTPLAVFLNTDDSECHKTGNNSTNDTGNSNNLDLRFSNIAQNFKNSIGAKSLFSIIVKSIPSRHLREIDFTFEFQYSNGKKGRVSIVDFIATMLLETEKTPTSEMIFFNEYLKSKCCIPSVLVKNTLFS